MFLCVCALPARSPACGGTSPDMALWHRGPAGKEDRDSQPVPGLDTLRQTSLLGGVMYPVNACKHQRVSLTLYVYVYICMYAFVYAYI